MVRTEDVIENLRAKNLREAHALALRRQAAHEEGVRLASILLREHPESVRVWGFGSTFETWRHYRADSDIDLAVENGDAGNLLKIVECSSFEVDVVVLADVPESMSSFIRSQGELLGAL